MHRLATAILTVAFALPAHATQPSRTQEGGRWTLELTMVGNYPVVSAHTPGHAAPLRLIVDTAAGGTVLDASLAQQLGVTEDAPVGVHGASGVATAKRASEAIRITLGDDLVLAVQPVLTDMSRFGKDDITYDGILGNDVLRRFDVRFDVPAGILLLASPGSAPSPIADLECIDNLRPRDAGPALAGFGFFDLELSVADAPDGRATVRAVLDTGAAATLLNRSAAQALGVTETDPRLRVHEPGTKGFSSDRVATQLLDLASARVGDWHHGPATVRVSELPVFEVLNLHEVPAAIAGIDLLRDVPIGFDAGLGSLCFGKAR